MSRWFRFYDDTLNDPKILLLPSDLYRIWTQLLCVASKNDGVLPDIEHVTVMLRFTSVSCAQEAIDSLLARRLLDRVNEKTIAPHNWRKRQYKSDVSTERVQRFRERQRNVSVTPPDTETEAYTETERKKERIGTEENVSQSTNGTSHFESQQPSTEVKRYEFEGKIVRLTAKNWKQWKEAYSYLDLRAELTARDAWLASDASEADRGRWFVSTSKYLANRNAEAKALRPSGVGGITRLPNGEVDMRSLGII